MTTQSWGLTASLLNEVFPFHLVLDQQLQIVQAGPSLRRIAPHATAGTPLLEVAAVTAPPGPRTYDAFRKATRSLFLLTLAGSDLVLRGQVMCDEEAGVLVFAGSPWITDLDSMRTLGLTLADFAVADNILDYLLLLQTQGHALAQAEEMGTRLTQAATQLSHQAQHDQLTGLANRDLFSELLQGALTQSGSHAVGVLLMDLDGFKDINDSLGHDTGDLVLQEVARRVRSAVRVGDSVARLGGDEFVILLPAIHDFVDAAVVAEKIGGSLAAPFSVDGIELRLAASIGITTSPLGAEGAGTLLKQADVAMYRAKALGWDWAAFDSAEDDLAADRLQLVVALRTAIESGQLEVAYQPIIETSTRRVTCFEALARWTDPGRGVIPPDRFIPLAEQANLIAPLTRLILRKAATECAGWRAAGHDVRIAVNLSVDVIDKVDAVTLVSDELRGAGLDPQHLTLEITESSLASDLERMLSTLEGLRGLGVTVSIDDFGTGFSAMSYLKQLPVSELKIDRSFVRDIAAEPRDVEIVRSLVRLAHSLSLRVVAEGVESVSALEVLTALGCDFAQGYDIARPMPAGDVRPWLTARNEPRAAADRLDAVTGPRHLLVVDDSAATRAHLSALAAERGWQVREATSAEEALVAVELALPDVIILDHHMTGMSGVDAVPALRQRGFSGPILLFTQFLNEALPSMRVPLDVWPVAKSNPDAIFTLIDAYRATATPQPRSAAPNTLAGSARVPSGRRADYAR